MWKFDGFITRKPRPEGCVLLCEFSTLCWCCFISHIEGKPWTWCHPDRHLQYPLDRGVLDTALGLGVKSRDWGDSQIRNSIKSFVPVDQHPLVNGHHIQPWAPKEDELVRKKKKTHPISARMDRNLGWIESPICYKRCLVSNSIGLAPGIYFPLPTIWSRNYFSLRVKNILDIYYNLVYMFMSLMSCVQPVNVKQNIISGLPSKTSTSFVYVSVIQ